MEPSSTITRWHVANSTDLHGYILMYLSAQSCGALAVYPIHSGFLTAEHFTNHENEETVANAAKNFIVGKFGDNVVFEKAFPVQTNPL